MKETIKQPTKINRKTQQPEITQTFTGEMLHASREMYQPEMHFQRAKKGFLPVLVAEDSASSTDLNYLNHV